MLFNEKCISTYDLEFNILLATIPMFYYDIDNLF